MKSVTIFFLFLVLLVSCKSKNALFHQVSSSHSKIYFNNKITENDSFNIINLENIYNGGGVGIADFNNDGLQDIYFTGNMVSNKLYLNKGELEFKDITTIAGVEGEGKWARGVSIVDLNNDGWQDIYICETLLKDSFKRQNILYINQGLNKNGIPVFKDMANEYGLNDNSNTTQAAFFDYDNDGDLDVYLAVNVFARGDNPNTYRKIFVNSEHPNTDRLYRNDWDSIKRHPYFTNISRQAGISQEGFAHAVTICDINMDGWKDIFVTNDYLSENLLYINNGKGAFTNQSKAYFKHTSFNSMGADVVDINNDGLSDVIELDMNPQDNYRKKTMLGSGNYQTYINNDYYAYQYQYIRNCLHLNMGRSVGDTDSLSHPVFSDISFYSGVAETDWSWTPLVADFDNDGNRDLIVTNGFPKDVTDLDFMAYRNSAFAMNDKQKLMSQMPEVKISNYAFRNIGNLTFSNVTNDWGFKKPTFSNGAATADLDNDGDLDIVINNINDEALVYENTLNVHKETSHNYLQVNLMGEQPNKGGFGSWIKIFYNAQQQVYETNPVRGYLSSIQNIVNFGLGNVSLIDSLIVIWPNNKMQKMNNIKINQKITLRQSEASEVYLWQQKDSEKKWFREISDSLNIIYNHQQKDFNDFNIQRLLPHKLSQNGPPMAVGDINNDGTEDLVIGSSNGRGETIFIQKLNGLFERKDLPGTNTDVSSFAMGLQLFDADNDGDIDMYVSMGGYEDIAGSASYQDKFLVNDGKGNFSTDSMALPVNRTSKSCVRAMDFDKDGDEDLFIGGRVEPWRYPKPVSSYILRNDSKIGSIKFIDVTNEVAPQLKDIGLTCDAQWTDYNNDGWPDLILAGEWMPITFFKNEKGKLVNETATSGIADKFGWWNCLQSGDFDNDGDIDFIAGNAGENSFFSDNPDYPLNNYFNDFDKNGNFETITTKFIKDKNGTYNEYPTQSRDEVMEQLPFIKKSFLSYKSFAETSIDKLFSKKQFEGTLKSHANYFSTSFVKNMGNGKFEISPLPAMAQLAPVCGIIANDFNADGLLDVLLCGNDFGAEVFNGRLDALNGLVLKGNGKGEFQPLSIEESGIYIPGDSKALVSLKQTVGGILIIASQNRGPLKAFALH